MVRPHGLMTAFPVERYISLSYVRVKAEHGEAVVVTQPASFS